MPALNFTQDCHMHTTYSDGTASIDQMARSAIERGLTTIAITDHMPLPFPTRYAMDINRLHSYRDEIETARTTHGHVLTIYSGLEIEYIPKYKKWIKEIIDLDWDLLLVSIHGIVTDHGHFMVNGRADEFRQTLGTVFNGDAQALCRHYYQLIQEAAATGWFGIAGHLDVIRKHNQDSRYFDETSAWYQDLIRDTLDSLAKHEMKLEINMNGLNHAGQQTYPGPGTIQQAMEKGIPLVLGSDAHSPGMQAQFFNLVQEMGLSPQGHRI